MILFCEYFDFLRVHQRGIFREYGTRIQMYTKRATGMIFLFTLAAKYSKINLICYYNSKGTPFMIYLELLVRIFPQVL